MGFPARRVPLTDIDRSDPIVRSDDFEVVELLEHE